jgi:hypothetical protein
MTMQEFKTAFVMVTIEALVTLVIFILVAVLAIEASGHDIQDIPRILTDKSCNGLNNSGTKP